MSQKEGPSVTAAARPSGGTFIYDSHGSRALAIDNNTVHSPPWPQPQRAPCAASSRPSSATSLGHAVLLLFILRDIRSDPPLSGSFNEHLSIFEIWAQEDGRKQGDVLLLLLAAGFFVNNLMNADEREKRIFFGEGGRSNQF